MDGLGTGLHGTFVVPWASTEIDGERDPPRDALAAGVSWRWFGSAWQLDAAPGVLVLRDPIGDGDLRLRARRKALRLAGLRAASEAVPLPASARSTSVGAYAAAGPGLTLTDGRRSFSATLVEAPGRPRLLAFEDTLPPRETELWVVGGQAGSDARVPAERVAPASVAGFTAGSMIRTPQGHLPVEALAEGSLLALHPHGEARLEWVGRQRLSGARLFAYPELRPVRVAPGALGLGWPEGELCVGPAQRLLLMGPPAERLFGSGEVLVRAEDLVGIPGITRDSRSRAVDYFLLLAAPHVLLLANGLPCGSYRAADAGIEMCTEEDRARLSAAATSAWSELQEEAPPARRCLARSEAAILLSAA